MIAIGAAVRFADPSDGPFVVRLCKDIGAGSACWRNRALPGIDRQKPVKTEQLLEQGSGLQKHRLAAACRRAAGPPAGHILPTVFMVSPFDIGRRCRAS